MYMVQKRAHFTFTFLSGDVLRSRIGSQDGTLYLFAILPGVVWAPELGLEAGAHFTFYLFIRGCSEVQNRFSRWHPLPFCHFTWGWSELQNQASRRLILYFYIFTFLPGGFLRYTFRPKDGSFYLFTFSGGQRCCIFFPGKDTRPPHSPLWSKSGIFFSGCIIFFHLLNPFWKLRCVFFSKCIFSPTLFS